MRLGNGVIDLLKIASKQHINIRMYVDKLISSAVKRTISELTRVTTNLSTLLDHVYTNNQKIICLELFQMLTYQTTWVSCRV